MASSNLERCSGSGVLIVDTKTSSLLLVNDYTENYNCCGGFIKYGLDDPQRIEKTAREELYEETRTLFSYDIDRLTACPFVDLDFNDEIFRCYIFKIACDADICERFEKFNLNELPSDNDYLETTSISFFPLSQFRGRKSLAKIDESGMAKDRVGKKSPLNPRVISVIKAAIKKKVL